MGLQFDNSVAIAASLRSDIVLIDSASDVPASLVDGTIYEVEGGHNTINTITYSTSSVVFQGKNNLLDGITRQGFSNWMNGGGNVTFREMYLNSGFFAVFSMVDPGGSHTLTFDRVRSIGSGFGHLEGYDRVIFINCFSDSLKGLPAQYSDSDSKNTRKSNVIVCDIRY